MKGFPTLILFAVFFLHLNDVFGQSVIGKWYSIDPDGEKETIIELYQKKDKLFGKIIALLQDEDRSKTCKKCPDDYKNKPLLGLEILRDFTLENNTWTDGIILVPKTGREYNCNISIDDSGKLIIRGYIGFSLLGRSTYWYRVAD